MARLFENVKDLSDPGFVRLVPDLVKGVDFELERLGQGFKPLFFGKSVPLAFPDYQTMQFSVSDIPEEVSLTPFALLVNPSSMEVTMSKELAEHITRAGWEVEKWGDSLDRLSMRGVSGGMVVQDPESREGGYVGGAMREEKTGKGDPFLYSSAYNRILALLSLYKNNASVFKTANLEQKGFSVPQIVEKRGLVKIFYDGVSFEGGFDSLNINFVDTAPHILNYSFEFTVHAATDVLGGGFF